MAAAGIAARAKVDATTDAAMKLRMEHSSSLVTPEVRTDGARKTYMLIERGARRFEFLAAGVGFGAREPFRVPTLCGNGDG
jgi:hypothetical protein